MLNPPIGGGGEFGEQVKFYVSDGNLNYSANICSHPAKESMVKQKDGDMICTSSTLLQTVHLRMLIEL